MPLNIGIICVNRICVFFVLALVSGCSGSQEPAGNPESKTVSASEAPSSLDPLSMDPAGEDRAQEYLADQRIADLLIPCAERQLYNRDTAQVIPILVEKLERGFTEPLQRAKEELAGLGDEAITEVRRLAERWYLEPEGSSYVANALDVAVLSDAESAHDVVLHFLSHPTSQLRLNAIRGMARRHARPEDFDRLRDQMVGESVQLHQAFSSALYRADKERAEDLFIEWLRTERFVDLWTTIVPYLAQTEREEVGQACLQLSVRAPSVVQPFLLAAAAKMGDENALNILRDQLSAESEIRLRAAQALSAAGLGLELVPTLRADPDVGMRVIAAIALEEFADQTYARDALSEGIGDPSKEVRGACLEALLKVQDAAATSLLLSLLGQSMEDMQEALALLRNHWESTPGLAERAFEVLLSRYESVRERPMSEQKVVLKAMGQVPLRAAAKFLHDRALEIEREGLAESFAGLRAHHWFMIQAANTGHPGRSYLASMLEQETDPSKRLDLIWVVAADRTDFARNFLIEFLEDGERSPYETLFAAQILARLGPAERVAPKLQRICYRMRNEDVRLALRCLMWNWY